MPPLKAALNRPLGRSMAILTTLALVGTVSACGKDTGGSAAAAGYTVMAGDTTCELATTNVSSGKTSFTVQNVGKDVTEVYVYAQNGGEFSKVVGEKENIGPGTTQTLEVDLAPGTYQVACKPGMTGTGIRTTLTVTGTSSGGSTAATTSGGAAFYDKELEITVEPDGRLEHVALTATKGQKVEIKLSNEHKNEYYLDLLGPDGIELGDTEADGGQTGEFVAELKTPGAYKVKVFAEGKEAAAVLIPLTVAG